MAAMKCMAAIFFALAVLGATGPARADINQISAREVARNNNCTPSKIDIYQQSLGPEGSTVYKISCMVPKVTDDKAPKGADGLLVNCRDSLCALIRPTAADEAKK